MSSPTKRKKGGRVWVHDVTQFRGWSDSLKKAYGGWRWNAQHRFASVYERHLQMCLTQRGINDMEILRASRVASVSTHASQAQKLLIEVSETIQTLSRLNHELAAARCTEDNARVSLCIVDQELAKAKELLIQKRAHYDCALDGVPISSRVNFDRIIRLDECVMKQCADCTFRRLSNFNPNFPVCLVSEEHNDFCSQSLKKLEGCGVGAVAEVGLEQCQVVSRTAHALQENVASPQLLKKPEACAVSDEGLAPLKACEATAQREDVCMNDVEKNVVSACNVQSSHAFSTAIALLRDSTGSQQSYSNGEFSV